MGFMNFFVEKIPNEESGYEGYDVVLEEDMDDVNTDNIGQENLICDIYSGNELSDFTRSIFKVEELMNSFPKEMPKATKKNTVLSVLSTFNLTVSELLQDASCRTDVLTAACTSIIKENTNIITNNNELIEQKKLEIQALEQEIEERTTIINQTEAKIETERKRILGLVEFIGGEI